LQAEWHVGEANRQVLVTSNYPINVAQLLNDKALVIASSDPNIVTVVGTYLAPIGEGTCTIYLVYNGLTDTVALTIQAALKAPDLKFSTVADVYSQTTDTAGTYAYVVKDAVVNAVDANYGSTGEMTLVNGTGTALVYNSTADDTALTYSLTKKAYVYSHATKDFLTNSVTKNIKAGTKLDMILIRSDYKTTVETKGIIIGIDGVAVSYNDKTAPLTTDQVLAKTDYLNLASYTVKGKITGWNTGKTDGTSYGNFYLQTEGATGKPVLVYGCTATAGKLAFNGTSKTALTNPRDWLTNAATKDLKIGDEVTLLVTRCDYKGTPEITGILIPATAAVAPTIATKTLAQVAASTAADNTVIEVSGIVGKVYDNTKGNFYLDDAAGNEITVYGSSAVEADFVKTDSTLGYYTGAFTQNSNFTKDTVKACEAGDFVTLQCVVTMFNKLPEITGFIKSVVKSTDTTNYTYKFAATINTPENGTATISKKADLTWGETVTVTTTPSTGYKVDSVIVNHGKLFSESLTAGTDGSYTFAANVINDVVVTFVSSTPASLTSYSTGFEAADGFTASTTYNNTTEKVDGAEGKQWAIYFGTVSVKNKISDASSLQMRWYATSATSIPYAYTKFNVSNVTGITFKAYVGAATVGIDVLYSIDYGTTWATLKSFAAGDIATTATAYTANFTAKQDQCRIKFQANGTAPAADSTKIVIDDFAFVTTNA
jgi:hypothetical protein